MMDMFGYFFLIVISHLIIFLTEHKSCLVFPGFLLCLLSFFEHLCKWESPLFTNHKDAIDLFSDGLQILGKKVL